MTEAPVVDNRVKDVDALNKTIGYPILEQRLVVRAGWDHKKNRGHFVETLEPFLSLWSLAAHVYEPEWYAPDINIVLVDTASGLSRM